MSKHTEEVRARLTYIVESPSAEGGGFHPETVEAAKQALAFVQQVEAAEKLAEALRMSKPYVAGAYECAFPDADENEAVRKGIELALAHWEEVTKF